jgi:pimeloyl-ACP methyl ester carboxylesterase
VVLVHGGPGAPGSLAPVARILGRSTGVLEPWQSARSVVGQVEELTRQVERFASPPVALVGHSWGGWLSILVAAEHPEVVARIVLVGAGPFRSRDAVRIQDRRRSRLTPHAREELRTIECRLAAPHSRVPGSVMRRFGRIAERADSYDLLPHRSEGPPPDPSLFRAVWTQAEALRRTGALARELRRVRAPILVLHGRDDPHPIDGVVQPLRAARAKVRVVALDRCGHYPWWERYARDAFWVALRGFLGVPSPS